MKISSNQIIESAKKNLEKLFSNSFLLNKLNDNQFKDLVVKQISILNYYEKQNKSKKNKKADEFLKKINEVNNTTFSFIEIKYSKLEDALDDVNYLKTFINNVYKINLDFNETKNDDVIKAETIPTNSNTSNSFMGGMGDMPMNGIFSQEMFQEQWYRKIAYDKYCSEVIKGEFYEYKSKPIAIIIFKYLIAALMVIFMISIIVKITFQILVWDIKFEKDKQSISVFGPETFSDVMMILFMCFTFYRLVKPTKNENIKYFFQWKLITIIFCMILVSLTIGIPSLVKWYSDKSWETLNDPTKVKNMHVLLTISFVYYGEFLLIIVFIIIASVFNPKKDVERINKKMESLYSEVKNGQKDVPKGW